MHACCGLLPFWLHVAYFHGSRCGPVVLWLISATHSAPCGFLTNSARAGQNQVFGRNVLPVRYATDLSWLKFKPAELFCLLMCRSWLACHWPAWAAPSRVYCHQLRVLRCLCTYGLLCIAEHADRPLDLVAPPMPPSRLPKPRWQAGSTLLVIHQESGGCWGGLAGCCNCRHSWPATAILDRA